MAMKVEVPERITITRPDDWHLHLRDGEAMASVLPYTARIVGGALIMPNLKPPVTTIDMALAYQERILGALPKGVKFTPYMSLYLTDKTSVEEIERAAAYGSNIIAAKLYPAGATTNSSDGVTDIGKVYPVLERMEKLGVGLSVHGEVTDSAIDIFDREAVFINRVLGPITREFSDLRIVLEHVTTKEGVDFVRAAGQNVAATITVHHLLLNRNAIFQGGVRPHHYCLPVLKRETHRRALLAAATSGNPKFFLGTDSAPHAKGAKESACGCAGCYTAPVAIEILTEIFEAEGKLDMLEGFASHFGADFYDLLRNPDRITLVKQSWTVPASYKFGEDVVVPLRAGELVHWQVEDLDYPG